MTINKKGKKKTIVAKNESEVASTSSTSSALDVTSSESIEKSSTVVSSTSKVVQEARSIAESESRSNVVEMTSGSREVIMDSKGNVIKVIEQQPKTSKQFSTMSKTGASSQDFISGEQTQSIQQRKDHRSSVGDQKVKIINKKDKDESLRHHSATSSYSDIREEASSSSHKSVTASSTKNSSTSLTQDQHISSSSPTVHTSSSQSKHSSEISAHGIEKDGKLHVDTKKTSSSQSRLNVDGNVVSSSSHNVENQSLVEPSTTSHVTFVDDRRSSHDLEKTTNAKQVKTTDRPSKPGDSSWDGKFVYEKSTTPKVSRVSTDVSNKSDDTTLSVSSYEESSTVISTGLSTHLDSTKTVRDMTEQIERSGTLPSKASGKKTNDNTKRTNEPIADRLIGKHHSVEISDVTEEQNITDASTSSYIVEYKDAKNASKHVERITSVSSTILEEDIPSTPLDTSTPKRPGRPEKSSRPDVTPTSYKPGQSTWDGSFVYEKSPAQTPQRPERKRPDDSSSKIIDRRLEHIDIRDVTEDNSINEADIVTTSYTVEHSSSQQSVTDIRETSLSSVTIIDDGYPRNHPDIPKNGRTNSPENHPGERDVRTIKAGASTWDGTFKYEEKIPDVDKRTKDVPRHPAGKPTNVVSTSGRRNVSDTTLNIGDDFESSIDVSDVLRESIIVEQSRIHESYKDSTNIDLESTSVETVIIRDGTPKATRRVTSDVNVKEIERSDRSEKKTREHPDDRSERPTKVGSSTWDGSFVYEKTPGSSKHLTDVKRRPDDTDSTRRPLDFKGRPDYTDNTKRPTDLQRRPDDTDNAKRPSDLQRRPDDTDNASWTKRPGPRDSSDVIDYTTSKVIDIKQDVSSTSEFTTVEKSFTDTKIHDASNVASNAYHQVSDDRRSDRNIQISSDSLQRPDDLDKEHPDRATRPQKPGSSTWDGSFVYEKPSGAQKPADAKTNPGDNKGLFTDVAKSPKDAQKYPKSRGPSTVDYTTSSSVHDVFNTVHDYTSTNSVINVERQLMEDVRRSDTSNVSTTISRDVPDRRTLEKPTDGSSIRGPKDNERPRPSSRSGSPEKSPGDRTERPQKPGSSTWDGSFVYEKSSGPQKPDDAKTKPGDNKGRPTDVAKSPKDAQKYPKSRGPSTIDYTTSSSVHDVFNTVHEHTTANSVINVERQSTEDVRRSDTSNVSTTISRDVPDRRTLGKPTDGSLIRGPKDNERPRTSSRPGSPEMSPGDRTERPQKPGSSTWDGSFVYEKPSSPQKPTGAKTKLDDEKGRPTDVEKSPKDVQKHPRPRGPNETVHYTTSSGVHDVFNTVHEQTSAFINVERQTTDDVRTSDTSNVSTTIVRDVTDLRTPVRPTNSAPIRGSKDNERPEPPRRSSRPDSPEKSPGDRTERPQKPGSSTWDGSFVHEKPSGPQKPADTKTKPGDSKVLPTDVEKSPKDVQKHPRPRGPNGTVDYTTSSNVHDIFKSVHEESNAFINIERQTTDDVRTSDISNVSTTITRDVADRRTPVKPVGGPPIRGPKDNERPERPRRSSRPDSPEKSPGDRTERPQKPGSSTWDGSFVREKPSGPQKPADTKTKPGDSKGRPTDVEKSPKDVQKHPGPRAPNQTVNYTTSSSVHDVFNTVHEQTNAVINVERQMTDDMRTSNISNVSTTITRDVADRRTPVRPVDGAPIRGQKDNERPEHPRRSSRPDSPEKSPGDRTDRPQKPGSSTWDGSFVYEKPLITQKPTDMKTKPGDNKARPTDVEKTPKDVQKHPRPCGPNETVDYTTSSDVHDVFNTVHEQSNAFINIERQTTDDVRTSDISNVSTTITRDVADRRTPVRPVDGAPIREPKDNERPERPRRSSRPDSPEKSPGDRTERPQKPGSSTWDGSFVYEKPSITQKPTDTKTKPDDNKGRPRDVKKSPKDVQKHPEPRGPNETVNYTTSSSVHDISNTAVINVERQMTDDLITSDTSNVSTTIVRDVSDHRTPVRPTDGAPIRGPKDNERPERPRRNSRPDSPEKSPGDRTERPQKPGSSTWDGSFVYEKPSSAPQKPSSESQKPADMKTKPGDGKGRPVPTDVGKSPKDVQQRPKPRGPNETVNYTTSSSIHDISNTVHENRNTFINVEKQSTEDVRTRDTSNVSTTIVRDIPDRKHPGKPTDGTQIRGPKDERPRPSGRPDSPEKSPSDRTERPQKPGSSTWDGSFTYEKPQEVKKPKEQEKKSPVGPTGKPGTLGDKGDRKPRKPQERNGLPSQSIILRESRDKLDVTDVTDITDTVVTSEVVQHSSYVIDQSSSFTSITDIKDVVDISDVRKSSIRDVVS